jgi:hypothetical protein
VSFPSRQLVRRISVVLIASFAFHLSPLPVLAAQATPKRDLTAVAAQLDSDISLLETQGKEAFLDSLFERLADDEAKACEWIGAKVKKIGARKVVMMVLGLGSPVLAGIIAVLPQSWQEALVVGALTKFVKKAVREVKEMVSKLPATLLTKGLKAVRAVLGNPSAAASAIRVPGMAAAQGQSWWEKFFSNSTAVRNFIVTIVALSSIGVAVGLAIAGSTAAPVIAVVGALVALIALIVPGPGGQNLKS